MKSQRVIESGQLQKSMIGNLANIISTVFFTVFLTFVFVPLSLAEPASDGEDEVSEVETSEESEEEGEFEEESEEDYEDAAEEDVNEEDVNEEDSNEEDADEENAEEVDSDYEDYEDDEEVEEDSGEDLGEEKEEAEVDEEIDEEALDEDTSPKFVSKGLYYGYIEAVDAEGTYVFLRPLTPKGYTRKMVYIDRVTDVLKNKKGIRVRDLEVEQKVVVRYVAYDKLMLADAIYVVDGKIDPRDFHGQFRRERKNNRRERLRRKVKKSQ